MTREFFSTVFQKYSNIFVKIRPAGTELFHADEHMANGTDMT
jgi:hypothetical protein